VEPSGCSLAPQSDRPCLANRGRTHGEVFFDARVDRGLAVIAESRPLRQVVFNSRSSLLIETSPEELPILRNKVSNLQHEAHIGSLLNGVLELCQDLFHNELDRNYVSITNFGDRSKVDVLYVFDHWGDFCVDRVVSLDACRVLSYSY